MSADLCRGPERVGRLYDSAPFGTTGSGVPRGLSWLEDTLHGVDIYGLGFVRRPTLFCDPGNGSSYGYGTYRQPFTTRDQIVNAVKGFHPGTVLGFKRGSTLRATPSLNYVTLTAHGAADDPLVLCPYGDAEALPIIDSRYVVTAWTLVDADANIWSYAMGAVQGDCWQGGGTSARRLWNKAWSTDAVTTLTEAGLATYNSNTLYVRPYDGEDPRDVTMEVAVLDYGLALRYSDVAASGYITVAGIEVRGGRKVALSAAAAGITTITTVADLVIAGCRAGRSGVDNTVSALGRDAIAVYGASDAVRITGLHIVGNYVHDTINCPIEIAGTTDAVIEHNVGYDYSGAGIELWSSNSGCTTRYNWVDLGTLQKWNAAGSAALTRVITGLSSKGYFQANNAESGADWNVNDATNAKNDGNIAVFNLFTRVGQQFARFDGGTGHKYQHNTCVADATRTNISGSDSPYAWYTDGDATNGFVDIANNLWYYKPGTVTNRGCLWLRIDTALGAGASIATGDGNIYFQAYGSTVGNVYYNGGTVNNWTTYKTALSSYSMDQSSSRMTDKMTGGDLTAALLAFDEDTNQPGASSEALLAGLTSLTGIGTRYHDGVPYVAATCTIGAFLGG